MANTSILVTNIALSTQEATISEFFSFCGKITGLHTSKNAAGDALEAVITFESPAAAKTSLLLTNALINDKPITVQEAPASAVAAVAGQPENPNIVNKNHTAPAENRSATSVVASVLAAGYKLGDNALTTAKELDLKLQITQGVSNIATAAREKVAEVDQKLGLSEKAKVVSTAISEKAQAVDNQYHISEKATAMTSAVSNSVNTVARAAGQGLENVVSRGVGALESTFPAAVGAVRNAATTLENTVNEVRTEADKQYKEGHPQPVADSSAHVAGAAVAAPSETPAPTATSS